MRVTGERGSAMMLVPAGFLILIVLASIAVDSAAAYLGQRHLADAVASAANDAVTAGIDRARFYDGGAVNLDPATTETALCRSLAAQGAQGLGGLHLEVAITGTTLAVVATADVATVFARALPDIGHRSVTAHVSATAETAAQATPIAPTTFSPLSC